ncbi:MAG: hypothetical protein WCS70_00875 [Verrucomicrobiota bacterium]
MRLHLRDFIWITLGTLFLPAYTLTGSAEDPGIPWLNHLSLSAPEHAGLVDNVLPLLRGAPAAVDPDLAVVTFRTGAAGIKDAVIQLYQAPTSGGAPVLNPQGVVRDRVGESMADSADKLLGLVLQQPACFGAATEVRRQRRALNLTFNGDLTLLREQTVEPLYVVGVLVHAERYLPRSLSARVRAVVLTAQLDFGEWRGRLNFVTDNPADAEQVGNIVAAWRDLAGSLAAHFAGHSSGDRLRAALQASTVVVNENQVTATSAIPAPVVVRVAKEAAGHGSGCPPGGVCDRNKIAICHKSSTTLCLPPAAVSAHLAHGDTCGPCGVHAATATP